MPLTRINAENIQQTTLDNLGSGPLIANVQIANSSYTVLDDTAIALEGGYIILNGTKFEQNVNVLIDGTQATSITYISENQIAAQVGAKTAGSYIVYVVNTDTGATAIRINGLTYSDFPNWSTDSTLSGSEALINVNIQLVATDATSYSLAAGNTLPSDLSLNSAGYITGTVASNTATNYNFTVLATDDENQDSPRSFTLPITQNDPPSWVTASDLGSVVNAAAFSSTVEATDNQSVSYSLEGGSTLPTGLTLSSNGNISGTISVAEANTYSFNVVATDTVNLYSSRTFSVTVTFGDAFFNQTTLLLNGDEETFITDASDNAFTITPVADTRPSAFSPYNTAWSNYFDGTGDYLTLADNTAFTLTSDFTIECFFFTPVLPTSTQTIAAKWAGSAQEFIFDYGVRSGSNARTVRFFWGPHSLSVPLLTSPNDAFNVGEWVHAAIVRSGSTITMYINGVSVVSGNNGTAASDFSQPLYIGAYGAGPADYLNGYISNFRIVKGTAVYTAAFTPPTAPLEATQSAGTNIAAITGTSTSLLTCQSNRFIDNSTNNFTLTRNGDVKVTAFGPFTDTDTSTGSGYFDGTGDYLQAASNAAFDVGTGNFTMEFWVYPLAHSALYVSRQLSSSGWENIQWYLSTDSIGTLIMGASTYGGGQNFWACGPIPLNTWTHIAIVRDSTATNGWRIFINGTSIAYALGVGLSYSMESTTVGRPLNIGGFPGWGQTTGYIADFRFVPGTVVYTGNFTPPTAPLTATQSAGTNIAAITGTSTSLLTLQNRIGYNNSQPIDESGIRNVITRNGNASVGAYSPFVPSGWSMFFDGSGNDYLSWISDGSTATRLGGYAGNVTTLETWVYLTASQTHDILGHSAAAAVNGRIQWYIEGSVVKFWWTTGTGSVDTVATTGTVPINQWVHLAVVVDATTSTNSTVKIFINGVAETFTGKNFSSQTTTYDRVAVGGFTVGWLRGYVSNFRFVRATTDTVGYLSSSPNLTSPLAMVPGTMILLNGSNFINQNKYINSPVRSGEITITPFSPFAPHTRTPLSHSVYFDGTGDSLSVPSDSDFAFGTGDFTVEGWFYQASDNTYPSALEIGNHINSTGILFIVKNSGQAKIYSGGFYGGVNTSLNQWNHIAWVRSSGSLKIYVNGTLGSTTTFTNNLTNAATIRIASDNAVNSSYTYTGYISNLRVVKGTAVYTAAFTPPTAPLTATQSAGTNIAAITGTSTSLLTCQSPTVVDNSDNAFAITVNFNSQPTQFNPFGETVTTGVEYSPVLHGGSAFVDSSGGDYLSQNGGPLSLNTTAWTVECWIYPTSFINAQGIWGASNGGGAQQKVAYQVSGGSIAIFIQGSPTISATAPALNQWTHILISRASSGTGYIYYNGVLQTSGAVGTSTVSGPFQWFTNGEGGTTGMAGYISGGRVSNIARYTGSNFSVPSLPPTNDGNTNFLTNFTNAAIQDKTGRNVLETGGNARVVNGVKKFGSGAIAFDGSGDYLLGKSSENYQFRTGDFTIEFWLYRDGNNVYQTIADTRASGTATPWAVLLNSSNQPYILITSDLTSTISVPLQTWTHVAISRSSGTLRIFVDGVQGYSNTHTNDINPTGSLYIGRTVDNQYYFDGYIDDLRITKGVARYTVDFSNNLPSTTFSLK